MNAQERYLFDLQGFLVVEDALTPPQVDALNTRLNEQIAAKAEPDMRTPRFGGLPSWGEPGRSLLDNPRLAPYLRELLSPNYRLDHDYADVIRGGLGPSGASLHGGATPFDPVQYFMFRDGRMYNGLTMVAYNLKDMRPGDDGFGCVPGSHKSNYPYSDEWRDLQNPPPFAQAVPGWQRDHLHGGVDARDDALAGTRGATHTVPEILPAPSGLFPPGLSCGGLYGGGRRADSRAAPSPRLSRHLPAAGPFTVVRTNASRKTSP